MVVSLLLIQPPSRYGARNVVSAASISSEACSAHKTDERWFGDATEPDRLACASRPWNTLAGALA